MSNGSGVLAGADVDDVLVTCLAPAALLLTMDNGRDHLRYGSLADWTVILTNSGASDASGLSLTGLLPPAQVDLGATNWTCTGAGNGATCTASGTGNLADGGIQPARRSQPDLAADRTGALRCPRRPAGLDHQRHRAGTAGDPCQRR